MSGAVTKDGWTGRERDLASREIGQAGAVTQAARDAAADLSLACFPGNLEIAEWLRRGNVPDCAGRTADESSPWTLAFAKAIADERERCARIADARHAAYAEPTDWDYGAQDACTSIATAIRASGAEGGR